MAANRYWVGGTGTWNTTTTNWSATSGGAGGATVPSTTDTAIFDANSSPSSASYTVTRSTTTGLAGLIMNSPGANTLTFAGTSGWAFSSGGSITIGSGITFTNSGTMTFSGSTAGTVTASIASTLAGPITLNLATLNLLLSGNVATSGTLTLTAGTLKTNSYTISCGQTTWTGGNIDFTGGGSITTTSATGGITASAWGGSITNGDSGWVILGNAVTTSSRTVNIVNGSSYVPVKVYGAGTVTITNGIVGNFDTTNFTGTLSYGTASVFSVFGSLEMGNHIIPAYVAPTTNMVYVQNTRGQKNLSGVPHTSGLVSGIPLYIYSGANCKISSTLQTPPSFTFRMYDNSYLDLNGYYFNVGSFLYVAQTGSLTAPTINFNGGAIRLNANNTSNAQFRVSSPDAITVSSLNILGSGSIGSINGYTFYDDSNTPGLTGATPSNYSNITLQSSTYGSLVVQGCGANIGSIDGLYGTNSVKFIGTGSLSNKIGNIVSDVVGGTGVVFTTGVTSTQQNIIYTGGSTLSVNNAYISYLSISPSVNAYLTNGNVDSGNNSGWVFTIPTGGNSYQFFFNWF